MTHVLSLALHCLAGPCRPSSTQVAGRPAGTRTWNRNASIQPVTNSDSSQAPASRGQEWRLNASGAATNSSPKATLPPQNTDFSPNVSGLSRTLPIAPEARAWKTKGESKLALRRQ